MERGERLEKLNKESTSFHAYPAKQAIYFIVICIHPLITQSTIIFLKDWVNGMLFREYEKLLGLIIKWKDITCMNF